MQRMNKTAETEQEIIVREILFRCDSTRAMPVGSSANGFTYMHKIHEAHRTMIADNIGFDVELNCGSFSQIKHFAPNNLWD